MTYYWSLNGHLIKVDTALNTSGAFKWWQSNVTGEADDYIWPYSQITTAYDVDVQNIMTHEAGHWLVLGDMYDDDPGFDPDTDSYATMYGYADENETQKRSLEAGDIAGINEIY